MEFFNSLMIGIALVTVSLAVMALVFGFFYFGIGLSRRVSDIESSQGAFQSNIAGFVEEIMGRIPISENPGDEVAERRDQLLRNLRANVISRVEAVELNDILLKEKEAAQRRGEGATVIAIVLGLALLAAILAKSK